MWEGGHPWTNLGWSQLLCGMHGYSDMGGEGWTSLDYPWMVTVTLAYGDTLTWSGRGVRVDVPGLSMDGHSYSQLSTKQLCHPWMAVDCLRHHWTYLVSAESAYPSSTIVVGHASVKLTDSMTQLHVGTSKAGCIHLGCTSNADPDEMVYLFTH